MRDLADKIADAFIVTWFFVNWMLGIAIIVGIILFLWKVLV